MRGLSWKLWLGAGPLAVASLLLWWRAPDTAAPPAPRAEAPADAASAAIGGAPRPASAATPANAPPGGGAATQSGGYALTEGARYRPAVAEGGIGYQGYQIFGQAVAGDVDGDGRDDVVVAAADNSVQVFLQQPQGGLPSSPQVWRFPHDGLYRQMKLQLIDLNADGALDILASRDRSESTGLAAGLNVLLSDGHGGLSLRQWVGDAMLGSTMDVDQDGLDDLVTIVYRGSLAGDCADVADLSGAYCTRLRVRYSDGQGGIRETAELPLGKPVAQVVDAVDFDGDGRRDFVYTDADAPYGMRRAMWRRQLPQGGLGEATLLGSWPAFIPPEATVGDFNGDGRPDIATGGYLDGSANVYLQLAGGGLSAAQPYTARSAKSQLLAADFDGDGRTDLVSVQRASDDPEPQAVLAYHLQRDGALSPAQWNGTSHGPTQIGGHRNELAHGDFNGDGCRDVVVAADYEGVMFYYGSGCAQAAMSSDDCRIEQTSMAPAAALASMAAAASAPVTPLPPVRVQAPPLWSKPQARAQLRVPVRMQGASQAQARGRVTSRPKRVFIAPTRTHWRMLRKLRNR
ncbi:VCBS repeat-containing protein [Lysobacter yananisis]|uniref:VCBS repeat-containing protein n=1 Tax=Lysobacter yananisis TaxID=1003114 RepID=A0ABY9P6C4_9GAMM|nr:VCBS repeat-containing protein [Lysobacter yananisis]WMT02618.1 VCBS repeat-containing protein [Lysobacter yananisis]